MVVESWPIAKIIPYDKNPRKNDNAVAVVARSIEQFGFRQPIVVDSNGTIIVGHTRLKAAIKLGLAEAPVHVARDLSADQIRALRITDNKAHEFSSWDSALLADEIRAISDLSNIELGFTQAEIERIAFPDGRPGTTSPDVVPDRPKKPKTRLGDVYILGRHRLVCGDSGSNVALAKMMGDSKADAVVTDPPYGMDLDTDFSTMQSSVGCVGFGRGGKHARVIGDDRQFDPAALLATFESCPEVFLFGADYFADRIKGINEGSWLVWDKRKESQADGFGSEFELCWSKVKHKRRVLRHEWFGFLASGNVADARNRVHPTQKPVTLIVDILTQWATGEVIVDPYLGSGTTIIACEKLGRRCIGMEIDPAYCDVIVDRWETATGGKATRERR